MKGFYVNVQKRRINIKTCIVLSLVLNTLLELISRLSLRDTLTFMYSHPLRFLVGTCIILTTVLVSQFIRRQVFYLTIVSSFWLILGVVNAVLLGIRSTPLSAVDMTMARYAITIWDAYFTTWQVILIAIGVVLLVTLCVFLFRRGPRLLCRRRALPSIALMITLLIVLLGGNAMGLGVTELESSDLEGTYEDFGFAYCFSQSFLDQKMDEPDGYSEEAVAEIIDDLVPVSEGDGSTPNVIFLQLESWVDVGRVTGLELSENPIPNYTALREEYSGGLLTVSTIGGGTINTEFEILTGMSMDFLGNGAYPFTTIVEETTVDSLAYAFADLGYSTTAIHNHQGTFYDRYLGYGQLGFEQFNSLEFMRRSPINMNGWAKDALLTDEIMDTLTASDGPDYIHAVGVQTHGSYPTAEPREAYPIQVLSGVDESDRYAVEYYVSQMAEVDEFLGELIDALSDFDEDVVLVMYGDHLPGIESLYELDEGDRYQTEYVIWSNMDMERETHDLTAYQLGSYVQYRLGISAGIMPRYHQTMYGKVDYATGCALLQYDLLYGDGYAYGSGGKPMNADTVLGGRQPEIDGLIQTVEGLEIAGSGFNSYSHVYVDGKEIDITLVSDTLLTADYLVDKGQEVTVCQVSGNGTVLYETPAVVFSPG